jgi:hypothetical protein
MPLAVIITASIARIWIDAITLQRAMEAKHGARDATTNWSRKKQQKGGVLCNWTLKGKIIELRSFKG